MALRFTVCDQRKEKSCFQRIEKNLNLGFKIPVFKKMGNFSFQIKSCLRVAFGGKILHRNHVKFLFSGVFVFLFSVFFFAQKSESLLGFFFFFFFVKTSGHARIHTGT